MDGDGWVGVTGCFFCSSFAQLQREFERSWWKPLLRMRLSPFFDRGRSNRIEIAHRQGKEQLGGTAVSVGGCVWAFVRVF